ncbi:hypothetical protein QE152_g21953 [Popillia japonica]|uniref:Uncharacterized protein n=1 Tax=Popillia japonica TaxID=7064 RepID=A0AAW1KNL9_POPJA
MDLGFKVKHDNPRVNASWLSKLTFAWMARYFYKGVKRGIDTDDLFRIDRANNSEYLGNKLQAKWEQQLANSKTTGKPPSLMKAILNTFLWSYLGFGVLLLIQAVGLRLFQPQVLRYLLRLFTGVEDGVDDPLLAKPE